MERFSSVISRGFFLLAFILASVAVGEKLAHLFGYTLIRIYSPWRLLEFAAVVLLFVIALQLREIKLGIRG